MLCVSGSSRDQRKDTNEGGMGVEKECKFMTLDEITLGGVYTYQQKRKT